jgi:hypothetical protein
MADTPYPLPKSKRQTDWLIGTGATTYGPFGDGWGIFDNSDVLIETRNAATGVATPNSATAEKTSLSERYSPFTITFPIAITAATEYRVSGLRQHERSVAVTRGGAIHGASLEIELTKQSVVAQELRRDLEAFPQVTVPDFAAAAEVSAANSNASALAAAASAAAVAAAYDNFDDRYLGAKASEPALDNDGNALVVGALFYHTGIGMKSWSGTVWVPTSGSGVLQASFNLSDLANATTARTNLGLGTAATKNFGTAVGNLVEMAAGPKLPAVDGSNLTNLPVTSSWPGLVIEQQQVSGTGGGSSVAGTNNIRVLNTVVRNNIAGASLAVNQFTLPAGTYMIDWVCPVSASNRHQSMLFNVTDAIIEKRGTSGNSTAGANYSQDFSTGIHFVTLAASKVFEIRHYTETNSGAFTLGHACSQGTETYTRVKVYKT